MSSVQAARCALDTALNREGDAGIVRVSASAAVRSMRRRHPRRRAAASRSHVARPLRTIASARVKPVKKIDACAKKLGLLGAWRAHRDEAVRSSLRACVGSLIKTAR